MRKSKDRRARSRKQCKWEDSVNFCQDYYKSKRQSWRFTGTNHHCGEGTRLINFSQNAIIPDLVIQEPRISEIIILSSSTKSIIQNIFLGLCNIRMPKIKHKHCSQAAAPLCSCVRHWVWVGIIETEHFAFLPMTRLSTNMQHAVISWDFEACKTSLLMRKFLIHLYRVCENYVILNEIFANKIEFHSRKCKQTKKKSIRWLGFR